MNGRQFCPLGQIVYGVLAIATGCVFVRPETTVQGLTAPSHSSGDDHSFSQFVALLLTVMVNFAALFFSTIKLPSHLRPAAQFLHGQ